MHAACCNTNTWNAAQGSATVFINNKPAVRQGDQTKHCGGSGKIVEGSHNVMIGGTTTGGGGGGSSPAAAPPQSSGGGGGGAGRGASGGATGASSGSPGGDSARGRSDGGAAGSGAAGTNAADETEPDVFTLWMKPDAINGGAMVGETIAIIDPDTKKVVAEVQVDADGHVLASVPENKAYDLEILGDADDVVGEDIGIDAVASSHLAFVLFDAQGQRVGEGLEVIVRGEGQELRLFTDPGGSVIADLEEGTYEIEVEGQTFLADTLRGHDVQHDGGRPYEFQLVDDDDDEPDYEEIEQARQHRIPPEELQQLLEDLE